MKNGLQIGVLALQGDFDSHCKKMAPLVDHTILVRRPEQLDEIDGLIIPGGESTAFLKLLDEEFRSKLSKAISQGLPTLATCAGSIILAESVESPQQESLGLLNATVVRNSYGRQRDSFITPALKWSIEAQDISTEFGLLDEDSNVEGIFIRAPKFKSFGSNVVPLMSYGQDVVLLRQGNILAATFHPELSETNSTVHKMFTKICQRSIEQRTTN